MRGDAEARSERSCRSVSEDTQAATPQPAAWMAAPLVDTPYGAPLRCGHLQMTAHQVWSCVVYSRRGNG